MTDITMFDKLEILADLMPLDELISIKFEVRLIDPSLLINRIWRVNYSFLYEIVPYIFCD